MVMSAFPRCQKCKEGDLVLASGSVDQTGTYVFEVEPQGVASSRSKYANYWGVANGNDTMYSLWNPSDTAEDIVATFYYGDGSGKYTLPVHLAPALERSLGSPPKCKWKRTGSTPAGAHVSYRVFSLFKWEDPE